LREAAHPVQDQDPPSRQGAHLPSLRSVAETQLAIQFSRAGSYDGQSLGLLGLDAALAAAAIAGDQLLGRLWWLGLIGLLLSAVSCAAVLFTRVDQVGPRVDDLLDDDEALTGDQMERLLVESLDDSIRRNALALGEKSSMLLVATVVLSATILGAIIGVLAS
jgi:hypothetical protein